MTIITEAQLEAHVLTLAREQFAHMDPGCFQLERNLKFKVGRSNFMIDGAAAWSTEGRADLLLFYGEKPLAVIELKREDKPLTLEDLKQGQSYAGILVPHPPLVIVSNGQETWVRQAADGNPLPADLEGGSMIEKIFENVGKLAAADNGWAIEVLMGPEASVWVEAVRQRTDELIERMTGAPDDSRKPFGRGLLFHRRATAEILGRFEAGTQAILVEGAPLAGKSSVLRDLALATRASPDWAVFMVNGTTGGVGLFQRLANVLGEALEWKLNADDVRVWLRRMSRSPRRPALVLAVDGLKPGSPVAQDLEELAETGFGRGLRLIGCTERADDILLDATRRSETALASVTEVVPVAGLDDKEFDALRHQLADQRIFFYPGAELADEYRTAWLLRSVLSKGAAPEDKDVGAFIPATMGIRLVRSARERFGALYTVLRDHRLLARDALADEETPDPEVSLASANAFVMRRDALSPAGEAAAVALEAEGWVRFYRHSTGEDLVGFQVPEVFMSELALELADLLDNTLNADPDDAWAMLVCQAQRFFLGDVVGAHAIFDLGKKRGGVPGRLTEPLMNDRPEVESIAGKTIGLELREGEITNFHFNDAGEIAQLDALDEPILPYASVASGDEGQMYGNMTAWMMLSQLAFIRTAIGKNIEDRFDIDIMLWVGQAGMPLMRGSGTFAKLKAQSVQELGQAGSVLSPEHALAEPLTSAMHKLFYEEWRDLDSFFDRLVAVNSLPLTVRVHHALGMFQGSTKPGLQAWAKDKIVAIVHPLLRTQLAPKAPAAGSQPRRRRRR